MTRYAAAEAVSAQRETVLRMTGVTKRFGPLVANDRVDLLLGEGEILALLGENGAGKTTLMNLLFGHYVPDEGEIEVFGETLSGGSPRDAVRAGVSMVHQHFALVDHHTVLENIVLGTERLSSLKHDKAAARTRLAELADVFGLEIDVDARVEHLSVGEQQRIEILKALYRGARVVILDEPTAVLAPPEVEALFRTLRKLAAQGRSIIFISHKLREVMDISDRVQILRSGRVVATVETAQTTPDELAELMVGRAVKPATRERLTPGRSVLELDAVGAADEAGTPLLREVSLAVREHEILGIAGVAGNGQGPLGDLVSGMLDATAGEIRYFGKPLASAAPQALVELGVGRIPQDRLATGLMPDRQIWENLVVYNHRAHSRLGFLKRADIKQHTEALLAQYDVKAPGWRAETRQLSGGNLQKLVLARELSQAPGLIIASQPTRGLDIGAIEYVHAQLLEARARGAAILLISEDLDEIQALSDRVAVMYEGRISPAMDAREVGLQRLGLLMAGREA